MITKTKFVTVQPKSEMAKDRFAGFMDSFHSCKVVEEDEEKYVLLSISNRYSFEMKKVNDQNWEVIK
tara:strand:+ start:1865 stop:2065 length:201 start_codon:yes stop_codon:yes gene_type:complete